MVALSVGPARVKWLTTTTEKWSRGRNKSASHKRVRDKIILFSIRVISRLTGNMKKSYADAPPSNQESRSSLETAMHR